MIVSAGRFTERPVESGRPVKGAVAYWATVVVVVVVVGVDGVFFEKYTAAKAATATTTTARMR